MNLNERLYYEAKRTINIADRWYSESISECIKLQTLKSEMSEEEYEDSSKKIGSKLALICEYYLKGLLLPDLDITVPDSDNDLQLIASQLTDDEKYRLIINEPTIAKTIFDKYKNINGMSEKRIRKLQGISVKVFSHEISKMIGTLTMDKELLSKLSPQIRKNIYREMRHYFYPLYNCGTSYTEDELKQRIALSKLEFLVYDNSESFIDNKTNHRVLNKFKEYEKILSDEKVTDAYPKSRYGHLDGYTPNNEFLLFLADAIRKSLKLKYKNMITITDLNDHPGLIEGIFIEGKDLSYYKGKEIRNIFPDLNSKLYFFDGNVGSVTRVYKLDNYVYGDSFVHEAGKEEFLPILVDGRDFLYKLHTKGMNEEEIKDHDRIAYFIYDVPEKFININEDKSCDSTSLIYYEDGIPKSIGYKKGMLLFQNNEITQELTNIVNEYEREPKSRPTNVEFEASVPEKILIVGLDCVLLNELMSDQVRSKEIEEEKQ